MKRRAVLSLVLAAIASACSKFQTYRGPEVTRIHVLKGERRMYLMHQGEVLKAYDIGLGFAPVGHKQFQGDGKTPEGAYMIDRRNPNSEFHLSIGVSYPNEADVAFAEEQGRSPGGDIFIHGKPRKYRDTPRDWTAGCISVSDKEMEEIYAMVQDDTPIYIHP
ncbi:L,D-transpeptidase family protein [Pseudooceanicola sp. 200-1SW]|uniref:L,D-transpeptidase family protein n=1 Tax=Pseudooceanicola sp. 200-1SW TaxID=3425949 RepID=UPI003D7FFB6E